MFKERNQIEIKGGKKRTATSSPEKDINKTASVSTQHSDRETPSGQNKKGTKSSQDADRRRFAKIAMKRWVGSWHRGKYGHNWTWTTPPDIHQCADREQFPADI